MVPDFPDVISAARLSRTAAGFSGSERVAGPVI
jgi:hypothetical protein